MASPGLKTVIQMLRSRPVPETPPTWSERRLGFETLATALFRVASASVSTCACASPDAGRLAQDPFGEESSRAFRASARPRIFERSTVMKRPSASAVSVSPA